MRNRLLGLPKVLKNHGVQRICGAEPEARRNLCSPQCCDNCPSLWLNIWSIHDYFVLGVMHSISDNIVTKEVLGTLQKTEQRTNLMVGRKRGKRRRCSSYARVFRTLSPRNGCKPDVESNWKWSGVVMIKSSTYKQFTLSPLFIGNISKVGKANYVDDVGTLSFWH